MTSSKIEFKRAQPLLGTAVAISLRTSRSENEAHSLMTRVFDEARRLEGIFNLYDELSALSRMNRGDGSLIVPPELRELQELALALSKESRGAFNPRSSDRIIDLNGIAKGYIVDHLVAMLKGFLPDASGVVNAGGDLKFFGIDRPPVQLRLGSALRPQLRALTTPLSSVCSSSLTAKILNPASSTSYSPTDHLPEGFSVVATAERCTIADAFTKIGMMASKEVVQQCCERYDAQVLIFNGNAELTEHMGGHANFS